MQARNRNPQQEPDLPAPWGQASSFQNREKSACHFSWPLGVIWLGSPELDTSIPESRAQPESRVLDLYSPISDNSTVRSEQGIVALWLLPLTRIWSCFSNLGTSLK